MGMVFPCEDGAFFARLTPKHALVYLSIRSNSEILSRGYNLARIRGDGLKVIVPPGFRVHALFLQS